MRIPLLMTSRIRPVVVTWILLVAGAPALARPPSDGWTLERTDSRKMALADLAAVVECRADERTTSRNHLLIGEVLRQDRAPLPRKYGKWRVLRDGYGLTLIELPKRIEVHGVRSRTLLLDAERKRLVLPRDAGERIVAEQQLLAVPIAPAFNRDEWHRRLLQRTPDNGNGLTAEQRLVLDRRGSGLLSIGCDYMHRQRPDWVSEHAFRGSAPAQRERAALALLPRLMSCEGTIEERNWLATVLVHRRWEPLAWRHDEDGLGMEWWDLPHVVDIGGLSVQRLYRRDRNFHVILAQDNAARIANRLGAPQTGVRHGKAEYSIDQPQRQAADGWLEQKRLVLADIGNGLTEQGCYFREALPELGDPIFDGAGSARR